MEGKKPSLKFKAKPSPEHYHIVYNVPKEHLSIPSFTDVFVTANEGYQAIYDMAMRAQPNCEFYDDGQVGIETRLHGRADLWWIILELVACIKYRCTDAVQNLHRKRSFIMVPEGTRDGAKSR